MPSVVEISPVVLEQKMKMLKVYDNHDDDNDDGQILIRKANLSLQLRRGQKTLTNEFSIFVLKFASCFDSMIFGARSNLIFGTSATCMHTYMFGTCPFCSRKALQDVLDEY